MSSAEIWKLWKMEKEQLNFKITLSGTYWDKTPEFVILLDSDEMHRGKITEVSDTPQVISFDAELTEDERHSLVIRLVNKQDSDTVQNADKTEIVSDMLLNIEKVELDGISLGTLKWSHSKYIANNTEYSNMVNLGWNGDWVLEFDSPFYIWLLENT